MRELSDCKCGYKPRVIQAASYHTIGALSYFVLCQECGRVSGCVIVLADGVNCDPRVYGEDEHMTEAIKRWNKERGKDV